MVVNAYFGITQLVVQFQQLVVDAIPLFANVQQLRQRASVLQDSNTSA
mgnify:CR=1 FL=1